MIKILKSNKTYIILLITICFIFILSPAIYIQSSLNAISLWATKVVPSLLPFFIITRMIVNLVSMKPNRMDKLMNKVYHTGNMSSIILFLSLISGYPMGAKLVCLMHEKGQVNHSQAYKLLSICSVSGPMFMVGTVGVGILLSFKAGIIIMISNIISSLINGLLYRGQPVELNNEIYSSKQEHNSLQDTVYDSLISILMVGGFMLLSFLMIDILNNLNIIPFLSHTVSSISHHTISPEIVSSILNGSIEITRGIVDLSGCFCSLKIKTVTSSALIAFGGISITLQSLSFLSKLKISIGKILKQKITQCLICIIVSIILSHIFI